MPQALAQFWWCHVIPAKQALQSGMPEPEVRAKYQPRSVHAWAAGIKAASERMVKAAPTLSFGAEETHAAAPHELGRAAGLGVAASAAAELAAAAGVLAAEPPAASESPAPSQPQVAAAAAAVAAAAEPTLAAAELAGAEQAAALHSGSGALDPEGLVIPQ